MAKFRKRPVLVEAYHHDLKHEVPPWLAGANATGKVAFLSDNEIAIHTLEGVMRCAVGDWVIQGVKGELYPCKPDIFAITYEPA